MAEPEPIYLEVGTKRVFAAAIDWPGWCREPAGGRAVAVGFGVGLTAELAVGRGDGIGLGDGLASGRGLAVGAGDGLTDGLGVGVDVGVGPGLTDGLRSRSGSLVGMASGRRVEIGLGAELARSVALGEARGAVLDPGLEVGPPAAAGPAGSEVVGTGSTIPWIEPERWSLNVAPDWPTAPAMVTTRAKPATASDRACARPRLIGESSGGCGGRSSLAAAHWARPAASVRRWGA